VIAGLSNPAQLRTGHNNVSCGEARATLHEIFVDKLYFQEGISILPGDIVLDVGANIGVFTFGV
jgi:31-O-methyltransferase